MIVENSVFLPISSPNPFSPSVVFEWYLGNASQLHKLLHTSFVIVYILVPILRKMKKDQTITISVIVELDRLSSDFYWNNHTKTYSFFKNWRWRWRIVDAIDHYNILLNLILLYQIPLNIKAMNNKRTCSDKNLSWSCSIVRRWSKRTSEIPAILNCNR